MASTEETSANSTDIPPSSGNDDHNRSSSTNEKETGFECNVSISIDLSMTNLSMNFLCIQICLETARDAVLSLCGHLFCWPCIHQWLETRAHNPTCPVCKSGISREKLVPIYGRNAPQTDPRFEGFFFSVVIEIDFDESTFRNTTPPRPAGTRQEPRRNRVSPIDER